MTGPVEPIGTTEHHEVAGAAEPTDAPGAVVGRSPGAGAAALTAVVDLVTAFGFVVGFNQLATQSPVDALLPVALFSVGIAGVLSLPAALLGARRPAPAGRRPFLRPPSPDAGLAAFALGLLTIAALGWRWGIAAQAALVAAQGVRLLLQTELGAIALLRRTPGGPDAARVALTGAEAVLLIGFAWAALADGSIRPFA